MNSKTSSFGRALLKFSLRPWPWQVISNYSLFQLIGFQEAVFMLIMLCNINKQLKKDYCSKQNEMFFAGYYCDRFKSVKIGSFEQSRSALNKVI